MMLTMEAEEAWWPPTFTPEGVRRTRVAWWTMLVASHSTLRWTASRTSRSMPVCALTGRIAQTVPDHHRAVASVPAPAASVARLGTESAFAVLARAQQLERAGRDVVDLEIGQPDCP